MSWERFDEGYDEYNGGAMYIRDNGDDTYSAAGTFWMDGGEDDLHYFAASCRFEKGQDTYGDVHVSDKFDAADAFNGAIDGDVEREIGWFSTIAEAEQAVEDAISTYLA